jgi:hypothetical protein
MYGKAEEMYWSEMASVALGPVFTTIAGTVIASAVAAKKKKKSESRKGSIKSRSPVNALCGLFIERWKKSARHNSLY